MEGVGALAWRSGLTPPAPLSLFPACSVSNDETEQAGGTRGVNDRRHSQVVEHVARSVALILVVPTCLETAASTGPFCRGQAEAGLRRSGGRNQVR